MILSTMFFRFALPRWVGARSARLAMAVLAGLLFAAPPAAAQILPWEASVATVEAGSLRGLAERLNKQNLLYKLHLGGVRKEDMVETARRIDHVLLSLQAGDPSHSIPEPWTLELRTRLAALDAQWRPLRRLAMASAVDSFSVARQVLPRANRSADPLLVQHFGDLSGDFLEESETLLAAYHQECVRAGFEVCDIARTSGQAVMLIERATRQAISVVAGFDAKQNRKSLEATLDAYRQMRQANLKSPFFVSAVNPERGRSAVLAGQLLESIRRDWDAMQQQLRVLKAGDEKNFDPAELLALQSSLVTRVERMTAALIRYASVTYGS